MDKFKGRYRIPSARWAAWDYGSNAAYFITICTANRTHYFGEVVDGQMVLTPLGQIATNCWEEIPDHFPFVVLDAFVVMPNHIHGIVVIDKPGNANDVETQNLASAQVQNLASAQAQHLASAPSRNRFAPQSQNLASIVRGYKIGVTNYARHNDITFAWQARYHDRVIRDADEHSRIQQYIATNPQRWAEDSLYH